MTPSTDPDALTAAFQPLSKAFLSAKAKAQLRDSKGRFIKMNSLVRWKDQNGSYSHGKVTGTPSQGSNEVQVTRDGDNQVVSLKPKQLEVVKALLPEAGAPAPTAKKASNVGVNYTPGSAADEPESPFEKVSLQSEVTADEVASLKKYTVNSYGPINKAYRGGTEAELAEKHQKITADLDALIDKSIVNQDLKLYRGVTTDGWLDDALEPGSVLTDQGFTSSSIKSAVANSFFKTVGGSNKALIEIDVPAGSRAANVSDVLNPDGNYDEFNENEFVFPRGSRLEVTEDSVNADGQRIIRTRLVSADAPETSDEVDESSSLEQRAVETDEVYLDSDGFVKVGNQQGSNPGGFYEDPDTGEQYYIKQAQDEKHALNEVAAARLYQAVGVRVPEVFVSDIADAPAVASKVVPGLKPLFTQAPTSSSADQSKVAAAADGFAVDAWLANWDVIGLEYDNLLNKVRRRAGNSVNLSSGSTNNPYRIDTGGALYYRAQGQPKGDLFGDEVTEIDSLRDKSVNYQSASVFSEISDEQIADSVRKYLLPLQPESIDALINDLPTDDSDFKQDLKDKLKARRENLLERFNVTEESTDDGANTPTGTDGPGAPEASPGAPDLDGGSGDGDTTEQDYDQGGVTQPPSVDQSELNNEQQAGFYAYTGAQYHDINASLRGGSAISDDSSMGAWITGLDSAIAASTTSNDSVLYRGANNASWVDGLEVGSSITDLGYVSTTSYYSTAKNKFNNPKSKKNVILEVHAPAGSNALDVTKAGGKLFENEFILPRGSSFKVKKLGKQNDGTVYVVADLVPATADDLPDESDATEDSSGTYLSEQINEFISELDKLGALSPTLSQELDLFSSEQTLDRMNELEEVLREGIINLPNTKRASILELFDEFRGGPNGDGWPFDNNNDTPDPVSLPEDVETPDATPVPSTGGEAVNLAPQVPGKKIYVVPVQHDGPQHVQVGKQVSSVKGDLSGTVIKLNPSAGYALVDDDNGKQLWRQWNTLVPQVGQTTAPEGPELTSEAPVSALAPQVPGKKIYSLPVQHDGPTHVQPGTKVVSSKDGLAGTITKVNPSSGYALVDNGEGNTYWRQWSTLDLDEAAQAEVDSAPTLAIDETPLAPAELEQLVPAVAPLPEGVPEHVAIGKFVVSKKDGFSGVVLKHNLKVNEALVQNADGKKLWRRYNTLNPLPDPVENAVVETPAAPDAPSALEALSDTLSFNAPSSQLDNDLDQLGSNLSYAGTYNQDIDDAIEVLSKDPNAASIAGVDAAVEAFAQTAGPFSALKLRKTWNNFKTDHGWSTTDSASETENVPSEPLEPLADWEKELLYGVFPNAASSDAPATPKTPEFPIELNAGAYAPDLASDEADQLVKLFEDAEIEASAFTDYLADFNTDADESTLQALIGYVNDDLLPDADLSDQPAISAALDAFVAASTLSGYQTSMDKFVNALNQHFAFSASESITLKDALVNHRDNSDSDSLENLDEAIDFVAAGLDPEQTEELAKLWDDLKTVEGWELGAPEEPSAPIDVTTPLENAGALNGTPVPGSPHLLEDSQGRYFINKHGFVLRKGAQVESNKDGYTGEIVYLEKQTKYAKVKDASGLIKLRQLDTLLVQGVSAQPEVEEDAPPAVLEDTAGKKAASALAPGDVVLTALGEQMTVSQVQENVFNDNSVLVTYSGYEGYPVEMIKTDQLTLAVPKGTPTAEVPLMQQPLQKYQNLPTSKLEPGMKLGAQLNSAMTISSVEEQPDGTYTIKAGPSGVALSGAPDYVWPSVWAGDPDASSDADTTAPNTVPLGSKLVEYLKPGDLVQMPNNSWKLVTEVADDPNEPGKHVMVQFLNGVSAKKYTADTKVSYQEGQLPPTWSAEELVPGVKVYFQGKLKTVNYAAPDSDGDMSVKFEGDSYPSTVFAGTSMYGESVADQLNAAMPAPELVPGQVLAMDLPDGRTVQLPAGASVKQMAGNYVVIDAFAVRYDIDSTGALTPMRGSEYSTYYEYVKDVELTNENPVGNITPDLGGVLALQSDSVKQLKQSINYQSSAAVRKALETLYDGDFNGATLIEDDWTALGHGPVSYGSTGDSALDRAVRAEVMKLVKAHAGTYSGEWARRSSYDIGAKFAFGTTERKALGAIGLSSADVEAVSNKHFDPRAMPQVAARINAVVSDPSTTKLLDELFGNGTSASIAATLRGPAYVEGLSGSSSPHSPGVPARPSAAVADGATASLGDYVSSIKDNDSGRVVLVTPDGKFRVQRSDGTTFTRKANGFKRIVAEQATSISPVKAVFLKSRADYAEPTWSASLQQSLSPADALQRIRTDVPSAVRGASIAVDDEQIEDLDVAMTRLRGANGEELIELKFKLTPAAGKAWKKRVELQGWSKSNMRVRSRHQLSNTELPVLGNDYTSAYGKTYQTQTERGAEVLFHSADNESVGSESPLSMHNLVQVYLPADATDADIQRALYDAGVDRPELATEDTARTFIENRMLSIFGGYGNPFKKPTGDERAAKLAAIEAKWGFTSTDVKFVEGTQGRVELRLPDEVVKKVMEASAKTSSGQQVKYLQHRLHGGDKDFVKIATGPHQAALGAVARKTEGIVNNSTHDSSGMSADEDVQHGSGQYVYASPVKQLYGQGNLIFPPEAMIKKFNFWANKYDNWGKRNAGENPIDNFYVGAHELMTKHSIDLNEAYGYSVYSQEAKDKILQQLSDAGIEMIGGKSVEEFVIVVDGYSSTAPVITPPVGLPVDQTAPALSGVSL